MSRPTHLLRHEHRVIEQAMRALEGMCIRMMAGSDVPDEELSKLLDFIRNEYLVKARTTLAAEKLPDGKAYYQAMIRKFTTLDLTAEQIHQIGLSEVARIKGEMQTTITLKKVSCGTELSIVQEGLPDVIPPEACCLGWQESLTLLAKLVEAEIPD